jgi:hypothetical protein
MSISAFDHEPIVTEHLDHDAKLLPLTGHDHFSKIALA